MKKILLLCFVLPILSSLKAQLVNVNIAITPPYSSRISDYANNPGKIILTLTTANSGPVVAEPRVLLKVTIKGDNGIILSTKNNYIPSQPIIVQSNAPKVVDIQTISELFDINSLSIQGITEKEITEKGGLPEGNYQFCVRAFLYDNPNIPASAESPAGCTYVRLTELDPPLLIKPFDKEEIVQMGVQNLIFSWSISPGAEPGTQYLFRMIEMLDPSKNPNDAMNARTTPAFFETITYSNILLYGPSEPTLVAGRKYAWSVTALPGVRGTAYKNNGRSEVRSFTYKLPSTTFNTFAKLSFIIPNKKLTEYKISNSKPLLLSWNWFDDNAKQDTVQVNDTAYKKYGATKYIITIKGISKPSNNQQTDKNFNKSYTITINNNTLSSKLQLTQKEILDAGMKLNYWYNATVESFDVNNNSIAKEQSVDFKLTNAIEETPSLITNIKGTIKYDYYGKPNLYNASNTPIEVRALRPFSSDAIEFPQIVLGNVSYNIIATQVTNTKKDGSFETNIKIPKNLSDKDLVFQIKSLNAYYYSDSFPTIKQKLTKDSTFIIFGQLVAKTFAYTLNVEVEKFYPAYSIKQDADGNLSIALDTSKQQFDYVYDKEKGMIYKSSIQKPEAGINMLLFRKNKNNYVPPIEGQLTESSNTTGFVIVAQGVTTIEKKNGKDIALVKFNNLLSNIYQGDEYFLVAVNAKNIKEGNTSGKIIVDGKEVPLKSLAINNEENFAEEKMIQIVLPPKGLIAKNFTSMLYRTINTVYNITSKKPPTSLVKGRIMYQWHGDKKGILRPYANQKFKIVVDYLADGSSVASTIVSSDKNSTTVTERFFVPEKGNPTSDGMQLSDYGKTMAIGKTDAQGNFELEVINLNPKGSIGKGKIVEKSWTATDPGFKNTKDPGLDIGGGKGIKQQVSNPGDNFSQIMHGSNWMGNNQMPGGSSSLNLTNLMNKTSQGFMNSGNGNKGFSYNTNTGFTEISGAADIGNKSGGFKGGAFGGPNINEEEFLSTNQQNNLSNTVFDKTLTDEIEVQNFERVFRIAPDNMFLSPSVQSFIVQPFQASNTGNFTSKVKETTKIVTAKENKTLLSGMKVTVFRRLEDKSSILPIGEGDGLYTQKKLINPEYNSESGVYYGANLQKLDKQNIYNTTFEQLWSGVVTDKDGKVELPLLLQGYNYYIQVCSDPTQGTNFYQSYFTTTGNSSNIIANMQPITSRVFVRVLDNATQKAIPYAKVSTGFSSTITDENGYTEIKVNDPILNTIIKKDNDAVTLYASSTGYNSESRKITFAKLKGFQQSIILSLNPGKTLTGRIISKDENNKAVQAYIKTKEGAIVETDANGNFKIAALNKENLQLQVIPKDVAYFDTTIIVPKSATALNNIGVYRKKHRIRFTIQDADDKKAINACTIQLGDNTVKTNAFGFADFIFENVSINNYTCIIRGPQGDNYIPISVNIKNEESTTYQYYNIKLEKGSEISGTVKLDGQPIKNAKVYIEYNNQSFYYGSNNGLSNDVNLNTAFTNSQGLFSLKGIPVNNKQINIIAVLDTNFTVNGDNQTINIVHKKATANLNLSRYDNMLITHIMGFPLTVEKIEKGSKADEVKVTGTIRWSKAISNFKWIQGNDILRIADVTFKAQNVQGKKIGVPVNDVVPIEGISSLKLSYLNKYNINLSSIATKQGGVLIPQEITLLKQNDYGIIEGYLQIIDNSFNYPSSYINFTNKEQFYLAEIKNNNIQTNIQAIKSAVSITDANNTSKSGKLDIAINALNNNQPSSYYLSNKEGQNISFKFIGFDATANAKKSYLANDGKIHLNINMNCSIENATPKNFSVNAEDVVLDNNNVYAASGTTPLVLQLEKWQLQVTNWKLDVKEGGILSNKGLIKTSAIDIPFQKFVLRSNMFLIDSFNIKGLTLGGGIHPLSNVNTDNASLVYDLKTGSDMQPHWRFSISSSEKPIASINNLMGLNKPIKLNYLQTISNNETVMQLMQETTPHIINNNIKAQFSPEIITNGPNFFDIYGSLNINLPRAGAVGLTMNYTKPQSTLQMKFKKVNLDFQTKGFIHFYTPNQADDNIPNITIDNAKINIKGKVVEKPNKSFNEVDADLFSYANNTTVGEIVLPKNYVMQLNSEGNTASNKGYKLILTEGGTKVINGDWDIFSYTGIMQSNNTSKDKGIDNAKMTFKVLGDVEVGGKGMKMDGIETPFGDMIMTFDFAQKRLIGTLAMNNVMLGTNTVNGTIETLFDPAGFYVAGGGSIDVLGIHPIVDGKYNLGVMLGSYPLNSTSDHLWQVVNAYKKPEVVNNCYITNIIKPSNNKFSGFYFTIDREIIDKSIDFDFILASGYVTAKAILGADVYANFSNGLSVGFGALAYAKATAGMSALTGTSLSGSLTAKGRLDAYKNPNGFTISANVDLSFKAKISQSLIATTVSKEISVGASAQCKNGTQFNFELTDGNKAEDCK